MPPKTPNPTTTDLTPHLRPSDQLPFGGSPSTPQLQLEDPPIKPQLVAQACVARGVLGSTTRLGLRSLRWPGDWKRESGRFARRFAEKKHVSREGDPPQKPPTQIKTVCTNSLRKLVCLFSAFFFKGKGGQFVQTVPKLFAQTVFIWVGGFWGGSSLHEVS